MPMDGRKKHKKKELYGHVRNCPTIEADAFLHGLQHEVEEQVRKYHALTAGLLGLEAQVQLAEKQLVVARDHLAMMVAKTQGAAPHDWRTMLDQVRFVGYRLADACVELLREHKKLTPVELMSALNIGTYRFRTNTPLREIHAALLRQQHVQRTGGYLVWTGPSERDDPVKVLKMLRKTPMPTADESEDPTADVEDGGR